MADLPVHDGRSGRSRCPIPAFTMDQSRRSRWSDPRVHDGPKSAPAAGRLLDDLAVRLAGAGRRRSTRRWPRRGGRSAGVGGHPSALPGFGSSESVDTPPAVAAFAGSTTCRGGPNRRSVLERRQHSANRDVIAERRLEHVTRRGRRRVTFRFMRPELEARPEGVWICAYEIEGLPRRRSRLGAGIGLDEVQALIGALQAVRQDLRLKQENGLRLL